jgi:WXXGXW repeat (2 copies)
MFSRPLITGMVAGTLVLSALGAEIIVNIAPPRPLVETRVAAPGRGYIWTPGYHRWDGRAYVWVPGQWVLPPRPRARWVPAHWARRPRGWVFVEGHWR